MRELIYQNIAVLRNFVPRSIRMFFRRKIPTPGYNLFLHQRHDPYFYEPSFYSFPNSEYTLGIIKEFYHYHKNYISACRELNISYKIIDISCSNWIQKIEESGCDAYLVHPSESLSIWKEMYDDRLKILSTELKKLVYPAYHETWLYENKRRVRDWLIANKIPHPKTGIFYNKEEALEFIDTIDFPIVYKTNIGAASTGVYIIKKRTQGLKIIKQAFSKGIIGRNRNPNDRQWGSVIFQQYFPNVKEWRLVRVGDSYFGHPKGRLGDFHSGSGIVLWDVPSKKHLDFLRMVTEKGNFTSMDVDVFETDDGSLLVNELQTVFGAGFSIDQLRVDGKPGRFVYDDATCEWTFEPGDFARNACANERVKYLISVLSSKYDN